MRLLLLLAAGALAGPARPAAPLWDALRPAPGDACTRFAARTHLLAGDYTQARHCAAAALGGKPWHRAAAPAWALVGAALLGLGQPQDAELAFAQAGSTVPEFDVLAPFIVGKGEVDGDPVPAGLPRAGEHLSELVPGGLAHWRAAAVQPDGSAVADLRDVPWGALVRSLSSAEVTEWQGWAVAPLPVLRAGRYTVGCTGVLSAFVDGVRIAGDQYGTGELRTAMTLAAGVHELRVPLRAKSAQQRFRCTCEPVATTTTTTLVAFPPRVVPHVFRGRLAGGYVGVPVRNDGAEPVDVEFAGRGLHRDQPARWPVQPGQLAVLPVRLSSDAGLTAGGVPVRLPPLETRREEQSFLFTFIDHDGSVGHAAAISPPSSAPGDGKSPVLLTLHGTGVAALQQADSYKRMPEHASEYEFGVDGYWVLAPSRHGAHNWEGTGLWSAMAALDALAALFPDEVDAGRVLFAGHSMGGHGAWMLASHFPDRALGVAAAAGWLDKHRYGDSNTLFKHDVGNSYSDPALRAVLHAAEMDNAVDHLAGNMRGLPVLARVGELDAAVPPWHVRRMVRVLGLDADAAYDEVPGQAHWWWDTSAPNDGGAVNDAEMRAFFAECLAAGPPPFPRDFEYAVYNPAAHEGRAGVRVLQQVVPGRRSTVLVQNGTVVATSNVASMTAAGRRPLSQLGPARQVYARPFAVVGSHPEALYVAQQHVAATLAHVPLAPADVFGARNVVVVGDLALAREHAAARGAGLRIAGGGFEVGPCRFDEPGTGAVFLQPRGADGLALIVTGVDEAGLRNAALLGTPTIPPMLRAPFTNLVPDFVVVGPEVGARGVGGYLAAGFFGSSWEYSREGSWVGC